ncbi:MAG TPA: 16S rRNA (guanine(527)-N(7))-methyltransferase RsmG [Motilibacterales bacterium]|nr:16S rRNA (guanine(527)-N(7))-methyltransferase RsmG [Motilibacterales bacterium]
MSDVPRETELSQRYSEFPGMGQFADILATHGVERGLIGPREVPRLWSRHLVNCAVVAEEATDEMPIGCTVADVGSGAGLPGIVWALVRPDLRVTLIEPLLRRATFLCETVTELSLGDRVEVVRARAEVVAPRTFDVVTARAVARLPQLMSWTLPLAAVGGVVLALKGSSAVQEVQEAQDAAVMGTSLGAGVISIRAYGVGTIDPPTTVVLVPRVR